YSAVGSGGDASGAAWACAEHLGVRWGSWFLRALRLADGTPRARGRRRARRLQRRRWRASTPAIVRAARLRDASPIARTAEDRDERAVEGCARGVLLRRARRSSSAASSPVRR